LACILLLNGCRARTKQSPESVETDIIRKIQHSQFEAAVREADEASTYYQTRDERWQWRFRILAARARIFRGEYGEAITDLSSPLPEALAKGDVAVLRKMTLATAEDLSERFSAAESDIGEAEHLAIDAPPKILMQVMQTRANLEFSQKKYNEAADAFNKALLIAREEHLLVSEAEALGGLGNASMGEEHYDEAADHYKASLEIARSMIENSSVPTTLGNLGWSYYALGDYESAKTYYKQAEQAALRAGQTADRITWLSSLAYALNQTHDYPQAQDAANEALKLARELRDSFATVQSLNALTEIALEMNRLELADKFNREATALEGAAFDQDEVVTTELDAGRLAERRGRLDEAEKLSLKVKAIPNLPSQSLWESEALLANVYREEKRTAESEREFRLCLKTVKEARSSVQREESRVSFLSSAIAFYGDYIDFLIAQGRPVEALQIAETSRARTLAEGLNSPDRLTAGSGSAALRTLPKRLNSTLLCYWLGPKHSHLWVIAPQKIAYFPLSGSQEIDRALKGYREALLGSRDALHPVNRDGTKLYSMLVEPAQDLIAKSTQVTILPDASLYGLNFETLIVPGETPHYWIEDVSITTASSLTLLAASRMRQTSATKKLLLIGNTEEVSSEFPKLPQASAEMQTVERYFAEGDRDVLEGKEATPAAYLSRNPQQFAYLHFVTHGTASLTKPMESAVILSPGADNYKLYARDIVAHHLNANLVTISACNGAGTRAYSGEGLVGLSWAFLRAGAHNVIGALWEVNDRSTPQLMDALYSGLSKGKPPATALRDAKLSFLHSGTVYSKPYYWAPFQLYAGS
jgi:CHAT domain-containing protein